MFLSPIPCPPTTIDIGDAAVENLVFLAWKLQDNYLLLALLGTCDLEAEIVITFATSSGDVMSRLTKSYANRSHTRITSLKERLSSITKGDFNVCDYLRSICSIAYELVLIGHFVDDLDLVIGVLYGLDPVYCKFCASIRTLDTLLMFDKLVDYEIFLQQEEQQQSSFPVTANHIFVHLFLMVATNIHVIF